MRISVWSSDVCSSDLDRIVAGGTLGRLALGSGAPGHPCGAEPGPRRAVVRDLVPRTVCAGSQVCASDADLHALGQCRPACRSEEHSVGIETVCTCRSRWTLFN